MDVGFTRAGFEVLWAAEKDQAACDTYNHNAEVAVSRRLDLETVDFDELRRELPGPVDCLFGGPPCQGFSRNSRKGKMRLDDPRNKLVHVFMDAVDSLRPRSFLMENVDNLGTKPLFKPILDKLTERAKSLGYACQCRVLDTHAFDVPQSRNRLIFVGFRGTAVPVQYFHELAAFSRQGQTCGEALQDIGRAGTPSNPPTSNAKIIVCKDPILRKSACSGSLLFNGRGRPLDPTRPCPTLPASMGGNATPIIDEEQFFGAGGDSVENLHAALVERNERVAQELTPELNSVLTRAANPRAHRKEIKGKLGVGAAARTYGLVAERENADAYDSGPQTKRRLEGVWASRATLLDAYAVAWVAPESMRRLTVTEAARLQTFPHDYAFKGSKCAAYRQIGNAVPCNFAYALAQAVAKVLRDPAPTPVAADGASRASRARSRSARRASSGA